MAILFSWRGENFFDRNVTASDKRDKRVNNSKDEMTGVSLAKEFPGGENQSHYAQNSGRSA